MADDRHDDAEKPLDPAVERVRRRLVKFVAINLGILFVALMAVVLALVYKSMTVEPATQTAAAPAPQGTSVAPEAAIALPRGTRILSQSLSGDRLSLHTVDENGAEAFVIVDIATGGTLATIPVTTVAP